MVVRWYCPYPLVVQDIRKAAMIKFLRGEDDERKMIMDLKPTMLIE